MVVDVDDGGVRRDLLDAATRPFQVSRVEEEREKRIAAVWRLFQNFVKAWQEFVHLWQRRRYQHRRLLACGAKRLRKRQAAAKCVPIRVLVTEDEDLLVGIDEVFDLIELIVDAGFRGSYGLSS
jgi:hypothetical protein